MFKKKFFRLMCVCVCVYVENYVSIFKLRFKYESSCSNSRRKYQKEKGGLLNTLKRF